MKVEFQDKFMEVIKQYVDDRCAQAEQKVDDLIGSSRDLKDVYDDIFALYPGVDLTSIRNDNFAVAGKPVHPKVFLHFLQLKRENKELSDALRGIRAEMAQSK